MKHLYLLFFLILFPILLSGQTNTDFWFAGPEVTSGHADSPIFLRVTSFNQTANVSISEPANTAAFPTQNIVVPANNTISVNLTAWKEIIESKPPNTVLNYGIHIHSNVPITAYYEESSTQNPEIFTLKGNDALGTSFYIPSQDTLYNQALNPQAYNSFDIIATEDGTTVTITPKTAIVGHAAKSTFTVTLNQGQVYSAQATGLNGRDHLMGSTVTSDKAVAITVKDDSDRFPGQGCYDLTGDQIVPVNIVGTQYIVVRGYSNGAMNDWVFVTATANNTNISVNGVFAVNKNAGDTYHFKMALTDTSAYVSTDKPVYVWHLTGYGCEAGSAILPPMNCTGSSQIAFTRTSGNSFELIILTKAGAQGSFTLDGNSALVTAAMFHVVQSNPAFVFARIDFPVGTLPVGAHILANSQDIFHMGVIETYDAGQAGCSYGYFTDFASLNLGPDQEVCQGVSITLDAGPNRLSYDWYYNGTLYTSGVQSITVSNPGTYSVTVNDHSCILSDTVVLSNYPFTNPVINGVTDFCEGTPQQLSVQGTYTSYLWTTGATTQSITVNTSGTYGVTVSDANHCTGNTSVNVTVHPLPTATISGTIAVCQNATQPQIIFTGASGTAPYTFTYNINGGSNVTIATTSGNSVTLNVPTGTPGTFAYSLVSVQDASSPLCSQAQAGSATVTVNALPTATISGTVAVCQNSNAPLVTFTGASATAPYTFTYKINGGANQVITTTSGNSVTLAAPTNVAGTFVYSLVSVQDGSSTLCSQAQAGSATVTVNPLPASSISGTTAVCQNSASPPVTFTGSSATAPYTFTYTINGGSSQTITTTSGNSISIAALTITAGTYVYDLVSVQDASLTLCSQTQTGSATVTVNPLPTATISGTMAVCQNSNAPLVTFTGAAATAPYTFTYTLNGGSNQNITTISGNSISIAVPTNTVGTFVYTLVSVQDASVTHCSQAQAGSATVTVNPLPTAAIAGNTAVCQNANAPLITFTGASATAPYTFTYKINGGANQLVSTTSGNSVTVAAPTGIPGTFIYTLVSVQDGSATTCSQAQAGTATVTVNPLPTATISGTTAVCQNSSSPLVTFTGASATAPYTFTYKINGGANQMVTTTSGSSVSIAVPTSTAGTFSYSLVSVQDGSGTLCSQNQAGNATITVSALPTASISGTTAVCQNAAAPLITFTGASATAPYSFTYNINGGASLIVTTTSGNSVTIAAPTDVLGNFSYNLLSVHDGSPLACQQAQTGTATIIVNPNPDVTLQSCNDPATTRGSKPLILKGGVPVGGAYGIDGNPLPTGILDPSTLSPSPPDHIISYTYTNRFSCAITRTQALKVNNSPIFTCKSAMTDIRDQKTYQTFEIYVGGVYRCWMSSNLNYGNFTQSNLVQTDNCSVEKYCQGNDLTKCAESGALYQWDELMNYLPANNLSAEGRQGLCPPEWHVPTEAEWSDLETFYSGPGLAGWSLLDLNPLYGFHGKTAGFLYQNLVWAFVPPNFSATMFWTSTVSSATNTRIFAHGLNEINASVSKYFSTRGNALPVRCVKDL